MRVRVTRKPVRDTHPKLYYPRGDVPIRSFFKKHIRKPTDPLRPGELPGEREAALNAQRYAPVPFRPVTGHKRSSLPPIKNVRDPKIYDATLLAQRSQRPRARSDRRPDVVRIYVDIDRKEYNVIRAVSTEYMIPVRALLRLMIRRFMRKGVILSGREIQVSERDLSKRQKRTLAKIMEDVIFTEPYVGGRGPDKVPYHKNPKKIRHITRLVAYNMKRKQTPREDWERLGLDTYQTFVKRYFPEVNTLIHEEHEVPDRPVWTVSRKRLPKPGPAASPPEATPAEAPDSNVADFAAEKKKRLIIKRRPA